MADKEKLRDMLDHIIDDKHDEAQIDFKNYLTTAVQEIMYDVSSDNQTDDNSSDDWTDED